MAIDLATETRVSPSSYCRRFIADDNGKPAAISTFYRHTLKGVRGVRLEFVKIGGKTFTTVEAIQRFADAVTAARRGEPPAPTPGERRRSAARFARDQRRAAKRCEELGV
jgi:hypothetical protein